MSEIPWIVPDPDGPMPTPAEQAAIRAQNEALWAAHIAPYDSARAALAAVLDLAAGYPYPDAAETAIVDGQAASALDLFRALDNPPADVVAAAAAVTSWRATL